MIIRIGNLEMSRITTGSGRPGLRRSSGLVDRQHPQTLRSDTPHERGRVPQDTEADLGEVVLTSMHPLHNGQNPVTQARMGGSDQSQ